MKLILDIGESDLVDLSKLARSGKATHGHKKSINGYIHIAIEEFIEKYRDKDADRIN